MFHFSAEAPEKLAEFYGDVFGWDVAGTDTPNPSWYESTGAEDDAGIDGILHTRDRGESVDETTQVSGIDVVIASIESRVGASSIVGESQAQGKSPSLQTPKAPSFGCYSLRRMATDRPSGRTPKWLERVIRQSSPQLHTRGRRTLCL